MYRLLCHVLFCAVLFAPSIAMAEADSFERPQDCNPILTVQKHGCEVETIFQCGGSDHPIMRSEIFDNDGMDAVTYGDDIHGKRLEFDGDGTLFFEGDLSQSIQTSSREILQLGTGRIQSNGQFALFGISKPVSLLGTIEHISQPLSLNGAVLERFEGKYIAQLPSPMPPVNVWETIYFDAATGATFTGEEGADWPPNHDLYPKTPAEIIRPDEVGFN